MLQAMKQARAEDSRTPATPMPMLSHHDPRRRKGLEEQLQTVCRFLLSNFPREKQQTKPVEASVGNANEPRVLAVCSVSISIILASKMILAGRALVGICFVFSNCVDSEAQSNTSVVTISTTLKYVLQLQLCGRTHGDHHFYQPAKAM